MKPSPQRLPATHGPIGVFDSGYGGLTILADIRRRLPSYDYLYLGDNARAPYGSRSAEVVVEYTRQAVAALFAWGCPLVILACNTASAKALRTIQQTVLPVVAPQRRVLGIIRPTAEMIGTLSPSRHIGIVGTEGTVRSGSYEMEIAKFFPDVCVVQQACPLWATLVEAGEGHSKGAAFFVEKDLAALLARDPQIDTLLLACTHYPLLLPQIQRVVPQGITIVRQGAIVAAALADYLVRHREIEALCTQGASCHYLTTENAARFSECAGIFLDDNISATHITLS